MKPSVNSKVGAGALAGATSVILVWAISLVAGENAVPAEIAAALTTVLTFAVSWFVPDTLAVEAEPQIDEQPSVSHGLSSMARPAQTVLN